mmetsp:Transcript_169976/g.545329  ORF Transcript_169976/g.545329 Transcript_169976/m.545329 type:complete len:191 (-) Transcript_169976:7-579(-)
MVQTRSQRPPRRRMLHAIIAVALAVKSQRAKAGATEGAAYSPIMEMSACYKSQEGVSLLRLRDHLQQHFGGGAVDTGALARGVVKAAQAALVADEHLPNEVVHDLQVGLLRLRMRGYHCRLGGIASRLLRCASEVGEGVAVEGCDGEDLEDDLQLGLGLHSDLGIVDILRIGSCRVAAPPSGSSIAGFQT